MRQAIHALKYDRLHSSARELGRMLAEAIAQIAGEAPAEMLVVPVPLHRSKYAQRGFNQSRSLAVEALRHLRHTHPQWRLSLAPSALMRLRATDSQAGLTPRGRRVNVRGAFSVSDLSRVKAQNILLVDDILTTGATARAAAQALINAGAASVWVATLARAQRSTLFGRDFNSARDLNSALEENSYDYADEETYEDGEILTSPATNAARHASSSDSTSNWDQPSF
jgi:ComF family protein